MDLILIGLINWVTRKKLTSRKKRRKLRIVIPVKVIHEEICSTETTLAECHLRLAKYTLAIKFEAHVT